MVAKKIGFPYSQIHGYTYNNGMTNLFDRGFVIELKGGLNK